MLCCGGLLPDSQDYAPTPVVGAFLDPDKAPRPEEVQAAVRPDDVGQQLPPLLSNILQDG